MKLTEKALAKIRTLLPGGTSLRLSVKSGGCSGLSYKMGIDSMSSDPLNDFVLQQEDVRIYIERSSVDYLKNVELDYSDELNDTGFKFINPDAKNTCGCKKSFST